MICKRAFDKFAALHDANPEALLADGFESAYIGYVANHHNKAVAVYDYMLCVMELMLDGTTREEAEEYMEFNVLGAYVGEDGPLFVMGF